MEPKVLLHVDLCFGAVQPGAGLVMSGDEQSSIRYGETRPGWSGGLVACSSLWRPTAMGSAKAANRRGTCGAPDGFHVLPGSVVAYEQAAEQARRCPQWKAWSNVRNLSGCLVERSLWTGAGGLTRRSMPAIMALRMVSTMSLVLTKGWRPRWSASASPPTVQQQMCSRSGLILRRGAARVGRCLANQCRMAMRGHGALFGVTDLGCSSVCPTAGQQKALGEYKLCQLTWLRFLTLSRPFAVL